MALPGICHRPRPLSPIRVDLDLCDGHSPDLQAGIQWLWSRGRPRETRLLARAMVLDPGVNGVDIARAVQLQMLERVLPPHVAAPLREQDVVAGVACGRHRLERLLHVARNHRP